VALYRVIVLLYNGEYFSDNNPDDSYWRIAAVGAVHETCDTTNRFWSLRIFWLSDWDEETECSLM
jgi:hypothetical protein